MYCMHCKTKREGRNHTIKLIRDGRRRSLRATCEICGTVMSKLIGKEEYALWGFAFRCFCHLRSCGSIFLPCLDIIL